MTNTMKIKKLNENANLPKRATSGSAGYDLYACINEDLILKSGETVIVPTGIAVQLPQHTAGMIYTRSGLGIKFGVHVTNGVGVIDSDYRGEIMVGLHNLSKNDYLIKPQERIAQLIVTPILTPCIEEVNELDESERNTGKFGSTGKI